MTKEVLDSLLSDLQEFFKDDYSGHDFNHTMRVYKLANNIAIQEHANLEIVSLAALLHDVDDVKLTQSINYQNARLLMNKYGIDQATQEEVIAIIQDVSFKGNQSKSLLHLKARLYRMLIVLMPLEQLALPGHLPLVATTTVLSTMMKSQNATWMKQAIVSINQVQSIISMRNSCFLRI